MAVFIYIRELLHEVNLPKHIPKPNLIYWATVAELVRQPNMGMSYRLSVKWSTRTEYISSMTCMDITQFNVCTEENYYLLHIIMITQE